MVVVKETYVSLFIRNLNVLIIIEIRGNIVALVLEVPGGTLPI